MRHGVVILNPGAEKQASNGNTPPHPDQRNVNQLNIKWSWLCSLTSRHCTSELHITYLHKWCKLCHKILQNLCTKIKNRCLVNSQIASTCHMTMPIPMWPTDFGNQNWLNAMQWEVLDNLHTAQTSGHVIFGLSITTGHTFMLEDYMWWLWHKASGGSSRNALEMGYTDLCINGNPVLYLW